MITPIFKCTQDEDNVSVIVECPLIRDTNVEVDFEETNFMIKANPYFLRLKFPSRVVSIDENKHKIQYDSKNNLITVQMRKIQKGENFSLLELTARLMIPRMPERSIPPAKGKITIISDEPRGQIEYFDLNIINCEIEDSDGTNISYGFNSQYSKVFKGMEPSMIKEIIDLKNPEISTIFERKSQKNVCETKDFQEDYYLFDYVDKTNDITNSIDWLKQTAEYTKHNNNNNIFNSTEIEILVNVGNREFLIENHLKIAFGCLDILLAIEHDNASHLGEMHCETSWAISKISSTLSYLDEFANLREVLISFYRRSLIYSLRRNWKLSTEVIQSVIISLQTGTVNIVKKIIRAKIALDKSLSKYILSRLYINDYISWAQNISNNAFLQLSNLIINELPIHKMEVNLELDEFEKLLEIQE